MIFVVRFNILCMVFLTTCCMSSSFNQLRHCTIKIFTPTLAIANLLLSTPVFPQESSDKLLSLSPSTISRIVKDDIEIRQALITADFTRSVYSEDCLFQDEIDTYPINDYVKGTKALFNAEKSHVDLVGEVSANNDQVNFKFSETLAFNIPFNPKVSLTGRVVLSRNEDGLIIKSREYWDQSVPTVLSTVRF